MYIRKLQDLTPLERLALIDISYSRLSTYEDCAGKYFHTYIEKAERLFGSAATLGNIVHSVLEDVVGEEYTLLDLASLMEEKQEEWDPDGIIETELIDAGHEMLREYHERHAQEELQVIGKEFPFSVVIGSAHINGYIDQIFEEKDRIRICDLKAQPLDALILTPHGWVKMGDIHVGDEVIGSKGQAIKVTGVYPQGIVPARRVTFTDGSSTVCSTNHLWQVNPIGAKERVLPLNQLNSLRKGRNYRYAIPTVDPVEFASTERLPIPAYTMGALLGDGQFTSTALHIHARDLEILQRIQDELPIALRLVEDGDRLSIRTRGRRNPYVAALKELGLWGCGSRNKFIPGVYLRASIQDRIDLVRGLMDTDGCASNRITFTTSSPLLAEGIIDVLRSLGCNPTRWRHGTYYTKDDARVIGSDSNLITPRTWFNPFYLRRKAQLWSPAKRSSDRRIKEIIELEDMAMQCIKVDTEDGLYVTDDYIVTHNTGKWEIRGEPKDDLQLGMYALALHTYFPDRPIYAELYYLRSGHHKGHLFKTEDYEAVYARVLGLVNKIIEDRKFAYTNEQWRCKMCDHAKNGACIKMGRKPQNQ